MKLLAYVVLFVGKLHSDHLFQWPFVVQQDALREGDAGQTGIKTKLDKIGTKKQEVEQIVRVLCWNPTGNEPSTPWPNRISASSLEAVKHKFPDQISSEVKWSEVK